MCSTTLRDTDATHYALAVLSECTRMLLLPWQSAQVWAALVLTQRELLQVAQDRAACAETGG